jgi:hypothetical protein
MIDAMRRLVTAGRRSGSAVRWRCRMLVSRRTLAAIGVYRSRIWKSEEKRPHPTENAEAPQVSDFSPRLWTTMSDRTRRHGAGSRVVGKAVVPHRLAERRFLRASGVEMRCYFVHTAIALLERFWQSRAL